MRKGLVKIQRYCELPPDLRDRGGEPLVINMDRAAELNLSFRRSIWTGDDMQVTLMRIPAGGETGTDVRRREDQLICVVSGAAEVKMGPDRRAMNYVRQAERGCAVLVPRRTWYNVRAAGDGPLLLFEVHAPPSHNFGSVSDVPPGGEADGSC